MRSAPKELEAIAREEALQLQRKEHEERERYATMLQAEMTKQCYGAFPSPVAGQEAGSACVCVCVMPRVLTSGVGVGDRALARQIRFLILP